MSKKNQISHKEKDQPLDSRLVEAAANRRKEWRFTLPLSAQVEGTLPGGEAFQEKTVLENISSTGAFFGLDSGITLGARLFLIIDLPTEITEGKPVRLRLEGVTVRLLKLTGKPKKQGIAMNFGEEYRFTTEEAET